MFSFDVSDLPQSPVQFLTCAVSLLILWRTYDILILLWLVHDLPAAQAAGFPCSVTIRNWRPMPLQDEIHPLDMAEVIVADIALPSTRRRHVVTVRHGPGIKALPSNGSCQRLPMEKLALTADDRDDGD